MKICEISKPDLDYSFHLYIKAYRSKWGLECVTCSIGSIQDFEDLESVYLNQTMSLDRFEDGHWHLLVNGPDGGIYFDLVTAITLGEMEIFKKNYLELTERLGFPQNKNTREIKMET